MGMQPFRLWVAPVSSTVVLCGFVLLPWGAAREWHVALSVVALGFVSFLAGWKSEHLSWVTVALLVAVSASVIFVLGELMNRGERWWLVGLVVYPIPALVTAAVGAGVGRVMRRQKIWMGK